MEERVRDDDYLVMPRTHGIRSALAMCGVTLLSAAAVAAPGTATAAETTLYVSPTGSDTAAGTQVAPLKTLGKALTLARNGQRVELAAGAYPLARDEAVRAAKVQVVGAGIGQTTVAGLQIYGGQNLDFSGITFTSGIALQGHGIRRATQPAAKIGIRDSEVTFGGSCVTIKEGAQDIAVERNLLRGCNVGVVGPGNPYISRGVVIDGNTIHTIRTDGIQFGSWSQVQITRNTIRDMRDPAGVIHNDGIQLTGNSTDVTIAQNTISNSRGQLIFIQDAIGPIDGVNVVNNQLSGASAVALQSQGATRASFVNNTIWNAKDGGLWLRRGYTRNGVAVTPTDTVLSNNVAHSIRVLDGAKTASSAGNVVLCISWLPAPAGATCVKDMGFVDAVAGNLRLAASSPARALGSPLALPSVDLTGATRTAPVPGAYV